MFRKQKIALALLLCCPLFALADEAVKPAGESLNLFGKEAAWKFGVGKPGGTGSFESAKDGEKDTGVVNFDFANGGDYVQIVSDVEIPESKEFLLSARSAAFKHRVTVRFIDDTDQTLQYKVPIKSGEQWVNIKIPLDKKAESWGGAADKKIHFPIKRVVLIVPAPAGETKAGKMEFADAAVTKK